MFLSYPNTIALKLSICLFLDWQWSFYFHFCLDALSSACWERGHHLWDQQKECHDWLKILPWAKGVTFQAFRSDPGLKLSLPSETHCWNVPDSIQVSGWHNSMLTESRTFMLEDLWGRTWNSLSSHYRWREAREATVRTPVDSQAPRPQITVFSESLNLYSLSTYTVADKFLNEYHSPSRWRIIQTQIRNTRELLKYPGECLFLAQLLCLPPDTLSSGDLIRLSDFKCHHYADDILIYIPYPDFYPITQNSKLTIPTVYIFTGIHTSLFYLKRSKTEIIFSQLTSQVIPFPEFPMWVCRTLFSQ